jgi:hypothetical protein
MRVGRDLCEEPDLAHSVVTAIPQKSDSPESASHGAANNTTTFRGHPRKIAATKRSHRTRTNRSSEKPPVFKLVLRLKPERAEEVLSGLHTRPMDFTGRPMKGFVFIEAGGLAGDRQLRDWVSMALSFARGLPAKARKKSLPRRSTTRRAERR